MDVSLNAAPPQPRFVRKDSLTTGFFFFLRSVIWTKPGCASSAFPHHGLLLYPLVTPRQKYKGMRQQKSFYTDTSFYISQFPAPGWICAAGISGLLSRTFLDARNCRSLHYPLGSRFIRGLLFFLKKRPYMCACVKGQFIWMTRIPM